MYGRRTWPGGHVWATPRRKNCRPCPPLPRCHPSCHLHSLSPPSHLCCPQLLPSDMPGPFSTCCHHPRCVPRTPHVPQPQPQPHTHATAPFDASRHISMHPAPSRHAAAIPDVSRAPFMCPSPSHNLTHALRPPSMHSDVFQHTPPLLDAPPPSQTYPERPSCAADQLQFLLTSDSISFYFPSILLCQLFSSFVSCNCTSLLVNLTNITTTLTDHHCAV